MDTSEPATGIASRSRAFVETLTTRFSSRNGLNAESLFGAAAFIDKELRSLGIEVLSQEYGTHGVKVRNLIVEKTGSQPSLPCIVVGAHYDTVIGTPGADDNASGVAGIIELIRHFRNYPHRRTLRFVAFPHEEPPYFYSTNMGSRRYAKGLKDSNASLHMMFALEMIGFAGNDKRQAYPFPLMRHLGRYPERGNYIALVSNLKTAPMLPKIKRAMKGGCAIGVESLAAPGFLPPLFLSDHSSFWKHGYPAIMVTDTAFLRNPHYHGMTDTSETLNYEFLAQVVLGVAEAIRELDQS